MSQRERIIGLVTVGMLVLLALNQLVISPLFDRYDLAAARADAAQELVDERQQLQQRQLLERRRWKKIGGELLRDEAAGAEGQLVNRVPAWAEESGLSLSSIRPDRADADSGFGRVSLRVTANGDLEEIGRFLYAVETAEVPVRVTDLVVTTREEGEDRLSLNLTLATIYNLPREDPQ